MLLEDIIISLLGVVIGGILLYFNRKTRMSLVGSFFKRYYDLSMVAIVLLTISFLVEFIPLLGIEKDVAEFMHHSLLIIAGIVFVFTSLALPQEASSYMNSKENKQQ